MYSIKQYFKSFITKSSGALDINHSPNVNNTKEIPIWTTL